MGVGLEFANRNAKRIVSVVQGREGSKTRRGGTRFGSAHVIGKSRPVQPVPPRDGREGLNFKSSPEVRQAFRPPLRLLAFPIFRFLAHPHIWGGRATHKETSIGIHADLEFLVSLDTAFLFSPGATCAA